MPQVAIEQDESTIHNQIYLLPQEIERLYEVAQTGAARSVSSLRDFLGINTDIHLNCLSFLSLPILLDRIKLYYPNHEGFHLRFSGEISGEIYTFFQEQDAMTLIQQMMGNKKAKLSKALNRIEVSVLSELVNILANSFWRAFTEKSSINWWITPPTRINDLARSLTYSAKVYTLDLLLAHFEFIIPTMDIRIQLVMLPTLNTMKKMLTKLAPTAEVFEQQL